MVLLGSSLSGCTQPLEEVVPDAEPASASVSSARWTLDWNWERAEPRAEGGWSTESDLDYAVHVERGWLVTHSVALSPCEVAVAATRRGVPWLGLLGIGLARAHHGEFDDLSLDAVVLPESLATPTATVLERHEFPEGLYCGVHWLAARGEPGTWGGRTALDWTSLILEGSWSRGSEEGLLEVDTSFAIGAAWSLDEALVVPGTAGELGARLSRNLGALFDGLDLRDIGEDALAWGLLANLAGGADVEVEVELH